MALLLSRFPEDVLQGIADFIDGDDLINLWLSGDLVLRRKLASDGGVSSVVLIDPTRSVSRWPSMLGELKGLRHVVIRGSWPLFSREFEVEAFAKFTDSAEHIMWDAILKLPKTLETLVLDCAEITWADRTYMGALPSTVILQRIYANFPNLVRTHVPLVFLADPNNVECLKNIRHLSVLSPSGTKCFLPQDIETLNWVYHRPYQAQSYHKPYLFPKLKSLRGLP